MRIVRKTLRWTDPTDADLAELHVYCAMAGNENTITNYTAEKVVVAPGVQQYELPGELSVLNTPGDYVFGVVSVDNMGNWSDPSMTGIVPLDFLPPAMVTDLQVVSE